MIGLPASTCIRIAARTADIFAASAVGRQGRDGTGADPFSVYVLGSTAAATTSSNCWWTGDRLCLLAKRLERNHFMAAGDQWLGHADAGPAVDAAEGIDWR